MKKETKKPILAIDIGGSKLIVGIVDHSGKVLLQEKVMLKKNTDEEYVFDTIIRKSYGLLDKLEGTAVGCAGVTIPGLADPDNGVWIYSCFSGLRNIKIGEILFKQLRVPVFIENDVNACAYGEKVFGSCKDTSDYLWITVSNGIGGGIFIDGRLYPGPYKNAGEIGHVNVVENGHRCKCGNNGCLEVYAAGPAIVRRYREKAGDKEENGALSAKSIAKRAREGERLAGDIYRETGYYLGKAIASAVNIINPQKVILGGGIAMDMDLFLPELKDTVDQMIFKEANKYLVIEKTALSYNAALIGAAAIAQKGMGGMYL